jgi:hypothetical protein
MGSFSYAVSRRDLTAIIESMPLEACRTMHIAVREGDAATAQRLLREAAENWYGRSIERPCANAPAAPAIALAAPRHRAHRTSRIPTRYHS